MEVHPYYNSWEKRFFDLVLSFFLLITLLPLFIVIAFLILLTAGWPILFLQKRCGLHKKDFKIYKFRTMYVGAQKNQWRYQKNSSAPAPMYKNWADPRFVGIGKWLSKTGLDELPQLFNIIKGEMSLVGPRPLPVSEAEKLNREWDFRYQVKPGVFSEWSCRIGKITLEQWRKLDQKMLKNGGLKYEVEIMARTLMALLK